VGAAWGQARRLGHAEVFAAMGVASFLAARFLPLLQVGIQCPLRALAGIPCATCGMTHAVVALAHGQVGAAFRASPYGALLALVAWALSAADLVRVAAGAPLPAVPPRAARAAAAIAVLGLLVNWAYLLAREARA
jgi:uncharacterized protein DUF2752